MSETFRLFNYINAQRQILVPCVSMQHIAPPNNHLLAEQEPYRKANLLTKYVEELIIWKKNQGNGPVGRKKKRRQNERWE